MLKFTTMVDFLLLWIAFYLSPTKCFFRVGLFHDRDGISTDEYYFLSKRVFRRIPDSYSVSFITKSLKLAPINISSEYLDVFNLRKG